MHNNQQSRRAPVVPFNLNPQWPQGYFRVLQALGVEKTRHSFYAAWVRQLFNQFQPNRRTRDLGRTKIDAFLQRLTCDPSAAH